MTDALVTTHDGIVGPWDPPGAVLKPHPGEAVANYFRWEPAVRAAIIDYELVSRLSFSASAATGADKDRSIAIWHNRYDAPGDATNAPTIAPQPLVRFDRPPKLVFKNQRVFLDTYADLRPDREIETLEQLDGPVAFLAAIAFLRPDTKRWTMELLDAALGLARFVEYRIKHTLACRRPIEYSPQIQPMILTPGHGTLPSGHATESFALAVVLWEVLKAVSSAATNPFRHRSYGEQFFRLASRIAVNRTVAGVHFPVDSVAGALLGFTLGEYFVARATAGTYHPAHFNGTVYHGGDDFLWTRLYDLDAESVRFPLPQGALPLPPDTPLSEIPYESTSHFPVNADIDLSVDSLPAGVAKSVLAALWERAVNEWKQ